MRNYVSIDMGLSALYLWDWTEGVGKKCDFSSAYEYHNMLTVELVTTDELIVEEPLIPNRRMASNNVSRFWELFGMLEEFCLANNITLNVINNKVWKKYIDLDWKHLSGLKKKRTKKANREYCDIIEKWDSGAVFDDHNIADAKMIGYAWFHLTGGRI